jgi:putative SOS response-associated peptidase YedK
MINARGDTVATKPSFRKAFLQRRCLIVADGFYEWKKLNGKKQPYYIRLQDDQPFAFAALWEHRERGGDLIDSCTILTTDANELVGSIHDRMPVILDPGDYDLWLDPDVQDTSRLKPLLVPYTSEAMAAYPVGRQRATWRCMSEKGTTGGCYHGWRPGVSKARLT